MQAEVDSAGPFVLRSPSGEPTTAPLFHAAWLFTAGITLAHFVWLRPSLLLVLLAPTAVLCGISAFRAQRVTWICLAVLWCLLGAWCAEMEPHPVPSQPLASLSDGLLRTVEGIVVEARPIRTEPALNAEDGGQDQLTQRLDVRLATIETVDDAEDAQAPIQGTVRLTIRWLSTEAGQAASQPFRCGQHIRAVGRLLLPEVYHDPGVWNRTDFLLDEGVTAIASVSADRVQVVGTPDPASFKCRLGTWQHAASSRLLSLPGTMRGLPTALRISEEDSAMLAAMVVGDRTYLNHSLRVGFERTGSFHMLVVSGMHLGIVAAFFFWIARLSRLPQLPATLTTIAASFAYALLTGFAIPVQRSLWMVSLYLLARLVYRGRSPLNAIGFASLCLLAVSPRSLFESSLQMTLLAVVSISGIAIPLLRNTVHPYLVASRDLSTVAIDAKLAPRLTQFRVEMRMIAGALRRAVSIWVGRTLFPWAVRWSLRIAELLVVSIVIELAMTLPMALYFHRITIAALPVNIFILPLLVLLMPVALLTLIVAMAWPSIAFLPAAVAAVFLHAGVGLVRLFGSLNWADFRIPTPLPWQIFAFCGLLGMAINFARRADSSGSRWQWHCAWVALVCMAAAAIVPRAIEHPHDALLVEALDVGQGDSLLLITPSGRTILVDGGGFSGAPHPINQNFDIGEEVVSPVLWSRGIRHLDVVALSHAHSDHMEGLPSVLRNFQPAELWVGNNPPVAEYRALLDEATTLHTRVRALRAGDAFPFGDTQVSVLAPAADYRPGPEPVNNDSLVLRIRYGNTSVLLEGDAEAPIERAMLKEQELESTLLKVGHHGSITSTRPDFLARVAPQWAVISCGLRNRYGHPRREVLEELETAKVRTLSTDVNGAVCFTLDGKNASSDPFCGRDGTP
jgi:competence protein ComEC